MPKYSFLAFFHVWCSVSSQICGLVYDNVLGKLSVIVVSNIYSVPFSLSSPSSVPITHMPYISSLPPQSLDIFCSAYFSTCSLCFSVLAVCTDMSSDSEILSSVMSSLLISPLKGILHSDIAFFVFGNFVAVFSCAFYLST